MLRSISTVICQLFFKFSFPYSLDPTHMEQSLTFTKIFPKMPRSMHGSIKQVLSTPKCYVQNSDRDNVVNHDPC